MSWPSIDWKGFGQTTGLLDVEPDLSKFLPRPSRWGWLNRRRSRRFLRVAETTRITIPANEGGIYHVTARITFGEDGPCTRYIVRPPAPPDPPEST